MKYFLLYLFVEVMVSSSVSGSIGGLNTFLEIIVSAVIGIIILQNFKYSLMDSIMEARSGQITQEEFIKTNVAKAIGAVLLIVPGFFTDIVGVLLQFGILTMIFSRIFKFKKINGSINKEDSYTTFEHPQNNRSYAKERDDEIIDVEVIDDNNSIKH